MALLCLCPGCSGSSSACPPDQELLDGQCICRNGMMVNGVCVDGDADAETKPESDEFLDEGGDQTDDATDETPTQTDGDDEGSELQDTDVEDSSDPTHDAEPPDAEPETSEEQANYRFPISAMVFSRSPVVAAKLTPDNARLAVGADYEADLHQYDLFAIPAAGGVEPLFLGNISWDPDRYDFLDYRLAPSGTEVLYSNFLNRFNILYLRSLNGDDERLVAMRVYPGHYAVSADGSFILFGRGEPQVQNGLLTGLYLRSLALNDTEQLLATKVVADSFAFTPDGGRAVFGAATGDAASSTLYDIIAIEVAAGISQSWADRVGHPYFLLSPDGAALVFHRRMGSSNSLFALTWRDIASGVETVLEAINWPYSTYRANDLLLGSDSQRLVFAEPYQDSSRRWRIMDRLAAQPLTVGERLTNAALMDPSGHFVALPNRSAGALDLFDTRVGTLKRISSTLQSDTVRFTDDGRYLLFAETIPSPHPQSGKIVIVAYAPDAAEGWLVAGDADGRIILPSSDFGALYYTDSDGFLRSVSFKRDQRYP